MNEKKNLDLDLQLFATAGNTTGSNTTGNDLSTEMKTYYSDYLIDMAGPLLVHDQFGQKHPIPKNGGKTIEFRKYSPLAKATTALTEGVTPDGQALDVSAITATVDQYGGWIQLPDMLLLTAIDNNMIQATQLLGDQAGRTLDTVTREVLNGGTNVQYYDGSVASRAALTGSNKLTVDCIFRAVRALKVQNAKPIDGSFVGIIHPDVAYVTAGGSSGGSGLQLVAPDGSVMPSRGRLQLFTRFGTVADIAVWKVRTDTEKIDNYLAGNTAAVRYLEISGGKLRFISAVTDGTQTEQLHDGDTLYWYKSANSREIGTENTGFPVTIYKYTETEAGFIGWDGESLTLSGIETGGTA